jgi:predicted small secreted protein
VIVSVVTTIDCYPMIDGLLDTVLTYGIVGCLPFVRVSVASIFVNTMNNVSPIVAFADEENAFIQVSNIGGSVIDLEDTFWNMFEKELLKYKNRLDVIFPRPPLHTVNVNTTLGHVFNNC